MPTIAMRQEDQDYAVSFALPADAAGIVYIMGRQSCDTRKLEEGMLDRGNIFFGGHEALYCGCIACASEGFKEPCGTYSVNSLLANIHKQNVTRFPYEISRIAQDIAGGLMVTLPSEQDLTSPETGKWLEKYYTASCDVPAINRMRILRLIENMTLGTAAVGYLTESMHGAGSPQAQRIMISRLVNMAEKKRAAKKLSGIDEE
jgi:4-hydroxybutyryl-CoA dehydratase/vinylacetyl-CoA-Delta-isomerase